MRTPGTLDRAAGVTEAVCAAGVGLPSCPPASPPTSLSSLPGLRDRMEEEGVTLIKAN